MSWPPGLDRNVICCGDLRAQVLARRVYCDSMRPDRRSATPAPESRPAVLIVDDVSDIRLVYRLMLEIDGFRVSEESDGRAALDRTARDTVDVVLADLYMPGS